MATDVLIAGAGFVGLVLACDLARRGVTLRIVELAAAPPDHRAGSRGKGIQPRTLEVYDDLGVIDAVHAAGGPYHPAMAWDGPRQLGPAKFHRIERREPTPDVPYPSMWMLPQPRALEILRARLGEWGCRVEFGVKVTGFTPDHDGVTASLEHADGRVERVATSYLVGADGSRSAVRAAAGIEFVSELVDPHPMITADVVIPELEPTHWHMWDQAEGGALWLGPLARMPDAFQLYAKFEREAPELTLENLRALVKQRTGRSELEVREVYFASPFGSRSGLARNFRNGRVFLAGDAAHVHPPAGGQGMNTAVQDAYNLGWKLGQVIRHGAPDALLDTYEAERLAVAAGLLEFVGEMHKDWLGKAKDRDEPRQGEHRQLSLNYRGGPLSLDERTGVSPGTVRAGDRAPDAPVIDRAGQATRLFDLYRGPHFTLLALGGTELPQLDPRFAAPLRAWRIAQSGAAAGEAALIDRDGHVPRIYGDGLVLVRPDGYVGYAGGRDSAASLTNYLGCCFGAA